MTQLPVDAARSWLETSDAVLRGLNHEFSNRLSLARLAPHLAAMIAAGEPDLQRIADDAGGPEDLLQLLRLYRLMVFGSSDPADPLLVSDIVPDAIDLLRHHTAFRDLEVRTSIDGTIPPVLMNPAGLTQALLLLLAASARKLTAEVGDTGIIVLGFAADADDVRISARPAEAVRHEAMGEPPELPALRYLIRDAGGAVEVAPGGVTMSIGTLVRLRRREKQG